MDFKVNPTEIWKIFQKHFTPNALSGASNSAPNMSPAINPLQDRTSVALNNALGGTTSALNSGGSNPPAFEPSFMQSLTGYTDNGSGMKTDGWGSLALSGIGTGINAYMGMQQLGLAKDQLAESKRQYNQNWAAQQKTVNSQMADRQAARVASNPNAYESVSSYMNKNGI